ncbi:uncharacterized protein LOC110027921 [Phalaenopsis equestris]|uniref:uncharacterized protein LOC110027921 n=1 Tax=Phalaenopsis equestris TaxID=78828 RepID=UPI0009E4A42C|nr:uncharacterized protein LOC110027921 [Phalaenopsis equestris]
MAKEGTTAVSLSSSLYRKQTSPFTSSFRFLDLTDPPNSSPCTVNHYELDEGDVVWSPDSCADLSSAVIESPTSTIPCRPISDFSLISPSDHQIRPFSSEKLGLAVALTEDIRPTMHYRRSKVNVPRRRPVPAEFSEGFHQSAPMNVPIWPRGRRTPSGSLMQVDDGGEEEAEDEMLPPHVIVARSHVTTFSVFEGVGRTLKGRDLCRLRNTVFQKTGFID